MNNYNLLDKREQVIDITDKHNKVSLFTKFILLFIKKKQSEEFVNERFIKDYDMWGYLFVTFTFKEYKNKYYIIKVKNEELAYSCRNDYILKKYNAPMEELKGSDEDGF